MTLEDGNESAWILDGIDISKPTIARVFDYLLGGYHNFEVDRVLAEKSKEIYPDVALASQVSRAFLRRAVRFAIDKGVTQFVDIGSGIPTVGHVHEILKDNNVDGRVVYVDIDPVAVAHSAVMLKDNTNAITFREDARHPEAIYAKIAEAGIIDFEQPVALLFIALLHFVEDLDELRGLIGRYRSRLAPGSYIAFTFGTYENTTKEVMDGFTRLSAASPTKAIYRDKEEIFSIFEGLEFVEPGIVYIPLWRPDSREDLWLDSPERCLAYAGVAVHR